MRRNHACQRNPNDIWKETLAGRNTDLMTIPSAWRTSERGVDKSEQFANLKEELKMIVGGGGPVPSVEPLDKEQDETMSGAREAASEICRPSAPRPVPPTDDDPMDIDSPIEDEQAIGFGPLPRQTAPSPPSDNSTAVTGLGLSLLTEPVSTSTRRDTAHEIPKPLESPTSPEDDDEMMSSSPRKAESGRHTESSTGLHASPPAADEKISPSSSAAQGEDNFANVASSSPDTDEAPTPNSFDLPSEDEEEDPVSENSWSPNPSDFDDDAGFDEDAGVDEYPESLALSPGYSPISPENDYFPILSPTTFEETEPLDTFSELRGDSPDDERSSGGDEGDDEALGFTPATRAAFQPPTLVRSETVHTYFSSNDDDEALGITPAAGFVFQRPDPSLSAQMDISPASPEDNEPVGAIECDPGVGHASSSRQRPTKSLRALSPEEEDDDGANRTSSRPGPLFYPKPGDMQLPFTPREYKDVIRPRLSEKKREEYEAEFERIGFPLVDSPRPASPDAVDESKIAFMLTMRHVKVLERQFRRLDRGPLKLRANEVFAQRSQRRKGSLLRREVLPETVREAQSTLKPQQGIPEYRIQEMLAKANSEALRQDVELQKAVDAEVARQMQEEEMKNLKANYENLNEMHADKRSKEKQPATDEMDIDPRPTPKLRLKIPENPSSNLDTSESVSSATSSRTVSETAGPSSVQPHQTSGKSYQHKEPTTVKTFSPDEVSIRIINWRLDESLRTISYFVLSGLKTGWHTCVDTRNHGYNFATQPEFWPDFAKHRYEALQQFDIPAKDEWYNPYVDCMLGRHFVHEKLWYDMPYDMEIGEDDASESTDSIFEATSPRTKTNEAKGKDKLSSRKTVTTGTVSGGQRKSSPALPDDWEKRLGREKKTYSDDAPKSGIDKWGAKARTKPLTVTLEAEDLDPMYEAAMQRFEARVQADKQWEESRRQVDAVMAGWF
ncbi:hypothetical protein MBLNU457_4848t1 [Dothideomycetes sp. NU457]